MSFAIRESRSGLVVAEQSAAESSITHDLRLIDQRLFLVRDISESYRCEVWKVFCHVSDWQPAIEVAVWCDDAGRPLPLSSGLLELVRKLRPENRAQRLDADAHNEQLRERRRRDFDADVDDLERHYRRLVKNGPDPHDSEGMVLLPRRFGVN